ncbi:hypothetical protein ACSBR1_017645 [Camellia fascicularis]
MSNVKVRHNTRPVQNEITHFSHCHALHRYKMLGKDLIQCDICEIDIVGKAWGCQDCKFFIHKSCKDVPREIKHISRCGETLTLPSSSCSESGKFYCNACRDSGKGFHYHCFHCKFDLHMACVGKPYTVYEKHKNPLTLCHDFPIETSKTVYCKVCDKKISKNGWAYYNKDSHFIAHVYCAFNNKEKDLIVAIQERLQSLQMK